MSLPLRLLLSLGAGTALAFAFAPYHWWWLAPLALAGLYSLVENAPRGRALLLAWLFGLGYFGFGVYWIYFSVHLFGAAIAPLAALITGVFVLVMSLFPVLTVWVYTTLRHSGGRPDGRPDRRPGGRLINATLFAGLWVLSELLRGTLMGGFPWILVGYSQTTAALGPLAPIVGVYGLSLLVVWLSVLLVPLVSIGSRAWRRSRAGAWRVAGLISLAWIVVPGSAGLVANVEWTQPRDEAMTVRLVQGNIPQEMKFSTERLQHALDLYVGMTLEEPGDVDLVIWPETAIPTYLDRVEAALDPFATRMDDAGIELLSGVFVRDDDKVYNSVFQLGGDRAIYRKRRLVPFGEYMPLRFVFDYAARFVDIPMSDLTADRRPHRPLAIHDEQIGVSICYEDVYGEEMRAVLPDATLLVNVSNDAWFGDSAAPWQHEQKARMRARELGRPLIRVTNTGVSSAIDETGRILGRIDHDTQGTLDVSVTPRTGMTPYARVGNWPVGILTFGLLLAGLWLKFARRRHP